MTLIALPITCCVCKCRPSTGFLIAMCSECFDTFEAAGIQAEANGHKYMPTAAEWEAISAGLAYRRESRECN